MDITKLNKRLSTKENILNYIELQFDDIVLYTDYTLLNGKQLATILNLHTLLLKCTSILYDLLLYLTAIYFSGEWKKLGYDADIITKLICMMIESAILDKQ